MKMLKETLPVMTHKSGAPGLCPRCSGSGYCYQPRPYYIGSRYYGDIDELLPCPECSPLECEVCGDKGLVLYNVPREHPQFGKLHPCSECKRGQQAAENIQRAALRSAELPETYKMLTFKSWLDLPDEQRKGKELAFTAAALFATSSHANFSIKLSEIYAEAEMQFADEDRTCNSLVFQGDVGRGKTGLAAAIVNHLVRETSRRVLYSRCRDLIGSVQARYGKDEPPSSDDVINNIKTADVLVIDEMNLAQGSDNRRDIMEEIMRHRHGYSLPTLITLNANRDAFEAEWGERTATVAWEMSHWLVVEGLPIRNEGAPIRRVK